MWWCVLDTRLTYLLLASQHYNLGGLDQVVGGRGCVWRCVDVFFVVSANFHLVRTDGTCVAKYFAICVEVHHVLGMVPPEVHAIQYRTSSKTDM